LWKLTITFRQSNPISTHTHTGVKSGGGYTQ